MSSPPVYKYNEINIENVKISELNKEALQPLAFISYDDKTRNINTKLLIQTDNILLTSYGVFYNEYNREEVIKIPLDPKQQSCIDLKQHLSTMDEFFDKYTTRKKIFGKMADKYKYEPCVRKGAVMDYCKMKFNIIPFQGNKRVNKTQFKEINGDTENPVLVTTMQDISKIIQRGHSIKFNFYYCKIWANKTPVVGQNKMMYGVGFKILAMNFNKSNLTLYQNLLPFPRFHMCDKVSLKEMYKKYMNEKKKMFVTPENLLITI
jgi:hypothetical protein